LHTPAIDIKAENNASSKILNICSIMFIAALFIIARSLLSQTKQEAEGERGAFYGVDLRTVLM
jgi:hypothetical protein